MSDNIITSGDLERVVRESVAAGVAQAAPTVVIEPPKAIDGAGEPIVPGKLITRKWSDISRKVVAAVVGGLASGVGTVSIPNLDLFITRVWDAIFCGWLVCMTQEWAVILAMAIGTALSGVLVRERAVEPRQTPATPGPVVIAPKG